MIQEKEEKAIDNLVETLRKTANHIEETGNVEIDRQDDRDLKHLSLNEVAVSSTTRKFKIFTSDEEIIELAVVGHPNLPAWLPELEL